MATVADIQTELDQAVAELKQTTVGYRSAGACKHNWTVPPAGTHWANALDLIAKARADVATLAPTPTPTPTPTSPTPPVAPRAPITYDTNDPDIAVNLYGGPPVTVTDWAIDGTDDSAVMLQPGVSGCTLSRFAVRRPGSGGGAQSRGTRTHGVYLKSPSNLLEDFDIAAAYLAGDPGRAVDGFSVRMRGNILRRCRAVGFDWPLTYYEHDDIAGVVTVEDFYGESTAPTECIWGDDSNGCLQPHIKQSFIFRRAEVHGGGLFLNFGPSVFSGAGDSFAGDYVRCESCVVNGRSMVASAIRGVPAGKIFIV